MAADPQLWVDRISRIVTSGGDLTLAHVEDYLTTGLIHIISESSTFPNRELLLPELAKAVNLNIKFRNALEQLKRLVDVKFDPAAWISTTSTIVEGGMDLTMADVEDYLVAAAENRQYRPTTVRATASSFFDVKSIQPPGFNYNYIRSKKAWI